MDPSPGQCISSFCFISESVLDKEKHPSVGSSTVLADIAICDFYFFPKVKTKFKETRFESVESVKAKEAETLKKLTEEGIQALLCENSDKFGFSNAGVAEGSMLKTIKFLG